MSSQNVSSASALPAALGTVVALTWELQSAQGELLDVLEEPVEFLMGGEDLLPAMVQALQGKQAGATLELALEPQDAFGDYDETLLHIAPRSALPDAVQEGDILRELPPALAGQLSADGLYAVSEIYPEHVVLDGNHPLAGMALQLALRVHSVREASADEIAAGTAGVGFFKMA